MASQRIGYIDIAKCVAIAFIVIGHMGIVFPSTVFAGGMPPEVVKFAFTFHLPVFFLASGYFFPEDRALSVSFLKKDAKALLLPYALTALAIIVLCTITAPFLYGSDPKDTAIMWIQAALWGAGSTSEVALWDAMRIGGIWFLLAMFWAHILICATSKAKPWARLLVLASCTAIAAISAQYVWLPFSIQSGLGCALFLYAGMLARKHAAFDDYNIPAWAMALFIIVWCYVITFGGGMSLAMQIYPLGAIDIIGGLCATAVIMWASRVIENCAERVSRFMQWIGRNTLAIFCAHIIEDNVLHWGGVSRIFANALGGGAETWVVVLIVRFILIGVMVAVMYAIPKIREVFFPQLRKAAGDPQAAALYKENRKKGLVFAGIATVAIGIIAAILKMM